MLSFSILFYFLFFVIIKIGVPHHTTPQQIKRMRNYIIKARTIRNKKRKLLVVCDHPHHPHHRRHHLIDDNSLHKVVDESTILNNTLFLLIEFLGCSYICMAGRGWL